MKLKAIAVVSLSLWGSAAFAHEPGDLRALGELFCALTRDGDQFAPRYLLTRSLTTDIEAAQQASDAWSAAHPGDKPPLGDGVQFASFPDGAPVCNVGAIADGPGAETLVDIQYIVGAAPEGNWTDRLVLRTEDGLPRIDDILYGSERYELGLRKALAVIPAN